jgi:hypothetical protein
MRKLLLRSNGYPPFGYSDVASNVEYEPKITKNQGAICSACSFVLIEA